MLIGYRRDRHVGKADTHRRPAVRLRRVSARRNGYAGVRPSIGANDHAGAGRKFARPPVGRTTDKDTTMALFSKLFGRSDDASSQPPGPRRLAN